MRPTVTVPGSIATIVVDPDALRTALVEALTSPEVVGALAAALGTGGALEGASKFMTAKEYAQHARMSPRTLDLLRAKMEEGKHYSRVGRRVRFHVVEADEFIARVGGKSPIVVASEALDLKEVARQEASRRRAKAPPKGGA